MAVSDSSILAAWSNFYVIVGSSAGALTGLMFVVVTLLAGVEVSGRTSDGLSTYSTPTVAHLSVALLGSAILSAPWHSLAHAGAMLALPGVYGVVYMVILIDRMRRGAAFTYRPELEDWIWYAALPFLSYITITVAAVLLVTSPADALFPLAGAFVLLIFIGIHNAWDIVTTIALGRLGGPPTPKPTSVD
jgi:hypothetical protein